MTQSDLRNRLALSLLTCVLVTAGCGSGDDDDSGNNPKGSEGDGKSSGSGDDHAGAAGDGAGGDGASGSGAEDDCKDDSIELQAAVDRLVGNLALDDDALYFDQTGDDDGVFRLPKTGGDAKHVSDTNYLAGGGPVAVDGDYVYFGDGDGNLDRIKKDGSGAPEVLMEVEGSLNSIAADDGGIYFVDGNICCASLGTDTTRHLRRYDTQSGEIADLAQAGDIESIVPAGDFVYWIGRLEKDMPDEVLGTLPHSLFKTPTKGGDNIVLFESKDDSGPNPGSGLGDGVVLNGSDVIFSSLDLDRLDAQGIYRIAQDAVKGTPELVADGLTLNQGFMHGGALYTNNGVSILRVSLDGGSSETVACGGMKSPIITMSHDDERIYYVRFDQENEQAIRSIALGD
jgi:hypothetical protein